MMEGDIIYSVNSESYLQGMLGTGRVDTYYAITTPLFPKIEYIGEDIISGNDDIINNGEQTEIFIILFNDPEWGDATNLTANLATENAHATIINNNIFYGSIESGEAIIAEPFIINFSENTPSSEVRELGPKLVTGALQNTFYIVRVWCCWSR